ncbi:MAG: hypothetical protein MRERV_18c011 [Mycoplasmataceae bacterium RV_VA103A]|nr:MAG: hypothetical protein MRERV_18c011 [Mycoplasmataceae bacterium RV_VA103A]
MKKTQWLNYSALTPLPLVNIATTPTSTLENIY